MAQGGGLRRVNQTYDTQLELLDAETVTATTDGTESAYLDLGGGDQANTPVVYADWINDISALLITDNDELYEIILEGSSAGTNAATFEAGTVEELARFHVGALEVLSVDNDVDSDTGRYVIPISNERNGRTYRYVRVMIEIAGTTTSITLSSRLAIRI